MLLGTEKKTCEKHWLSKINILLISESEILEFPEMIPTGEIDSDFVTEVKQIANINKDKNIIFIQWKILHIWPFGENTWW